MCGIGGIVLLDKKDSMDKALRVNAMTLLVELQNRGNHAWGVYLKKTKDNCNLYCGVSDSSLDGEIFKTKDCVTDFFGTKGNKIYLDDTNMMLMHTRASTQGSPEYNENNHPFNTDNFILAHNGCIHNDTYVKKHFKIETDIECDSYIIVALIQKFFDEGSSVSESIQKAMKEISGSFACWLYHKDKGDLYLFRNSNPLHYIIDEKNNGLVFASDDRFIERAYNSKDATDDKIKELEPNKVFKLVDNNIVEVCTLTQHTTGNQIPRNTCGMLPSNTSLNLSNINGSLVYLYKMFEIYEHNREIETVIAIVRNDVILLVKPKQLVDVLGKAGFDKYKKTKPVYGSDYYKYTITPKEKINDLVDNLKKELDDEGNNSPSTNNTSDSNMADIELYEDLAESIGCKFHKSDKYLEFEYVGNDVLDNDKRKMFSDVGLNFGEEGTVKMLDSEYHRERLNTILRKMEVDMND